MISENSKQNEYSYKSQNSNYKEDSYKSYKGKGSESIEYGNENSSEQKRTNTIISKSSSKSSNIVDSQSLKIINVRDQYLCPKEGCKCIPHILSAHCDTGIIVMKCDKEHSFTMDVEEYMEIMDKKINKNSEDECHKRIEDYVYDNNNKSNNPPNNEDDSYINIFKEKNKNISNIIRAYNQLLLTQEDQPDNFLHNQNLINLANQIVEENSIFANYNKQKKEGRDISNKKELKNVNIDKIIEESIKDNKENEEEALKKLNDEYSICLEEYIKNDELCLKLRGAKDEVKYPKLGNEGFKYISQIRFKDLIEINLSNNNISDITYLNNMLLPHLEILNFSDNQIVNITPVANLVSKNLFEIYLQNNQIEDITPFENAKFSIWSLKILRLDGNKFFQNERENQGKADIQKLVAKFGKRLIYEKKSWVDFNKKYNSDVDENEKKLDLGSKRNSDIIVDLLPLLTYPNNIKILILDNDKITDANYLTMMPLYKLTYLDLSLNYISNINFVKKLAIKCKDLKILYLHDNKINDLTPLMSYKNDQKELTFEKLGILTLKNNSLNLKDPITNEIIIGLVQKGNLTLDYKEEEMPQIKEIKASLDSQIEPPSSEHGGEYAAAKSGMKQLAGPSIICP